MGRWSYTFCIVLTFRTMLRFHILKNKYNQLKIQTETNERNCISVSYRSHVEEKKNDFKYFLNTWICLCQDKKEKKF